MADIKIPAPWKNYEEFLRYCESHCETERAGFVKEHIELLYLLQGKDPPSGLQEGQIYSWHGAGISAGWAREYQKGLSDG